MKNAFACLLMITLMTACTVAPTASEVESNALSLNKESDLVPFNENNPYELVGKIHDQLFESYYEAENLPNTAADIANRVEALAKANKDFLTLQPQDFSPINPAKIEDIGGRQEPELKLIIDNSSLSTMAKTSLTAFIKALLAGFEANYTSEELYDLVAKYEETVISNTTFTENDKRIVLITTAVTRHSAYMARKKPKKNKDPDWTILVGNIAAATIGAEESPAKAVTFALAVGIATNK